MLRMLRIALRTLQIPARGITAAEAREEAVRAKREGASQEAEGRVIDKNPEPVVKGTQERLTQDGETLNLGPVKRATDNNNKKKEALDG